MSDENPFPERPNSKKLGILIILLVIIMALWVLSISDFFEEPEEPEGIIVRFILFFKQNTLI